MTDYELELGSITERRNVRAGRVDTVSVDVHVRRAETTRGVADPQSGDYVVTFDVGDERARFRDVRPVDDTAAHGGVDDLALVAVRAAARELDGVQDDYAVESPLETIQHREYTVHDQL